MTTRSRLSLIVPTVGRSPYLQSCLEALATAGCGQILLAAESGTDLSGFRIPDDVKLVEAPEGEGFSGACNTAIASTQTEYVALVNDDAIIEPGWTEYLLAELEAEPRLAAVQGANVDLTHTDRVDGCGIAWNRAWQAVQIGRGGPIPPRDESREVFGVSCTAALLRRSALDAVALTGNRFFDTDLGTYYEDVDLAGRLRGRGFVARFIPTTQVRHAGAASSSQNPRWRWSQVYGNRLLVLARLWGRSFPPRLPRLLARDALDLLGASVRYQPDLVIGILRGWGRASLRLSSYAHRGDPLLPMTELHKFQITVPREAVAP